MKFQLITTKTTKAVRVNSIRLWILSSSILTLHVQIHQHKMLVPLHRKNRCHLRLSTSQLFQTCILYSNQVHLTHSFNSIVTHVFIGTRKKLQCKCEETAMYTGYCATTIKALIVCT